MTTIINTPGNNSDSGGSFGTVIIILLILIGGFLVYRYGWRKASPAPVINVTVPAVTPTQ